MTPISRTPNTLSRSGKSALAIAFTVLLAIAATLLFQAGPVGTAAAGTVADDPTNELPEAEGPRVLIRSYGRPQRLGDDREVDVARVRCVTGTCSASVENARIRVRGQAFEPAEVIQPMVPFEAGDVREIKVILPEAAVERLGGPRRVGKAILRVNASATLGEETVQRGRRATRAFKLTRERPERGNRQ